MKRMNVPFPVIDIRVQLFSMGLLLMQMHVMSLLEGIVNFHETQGKAQKSFLLAGTFRARNFNFFLNKRYNNTRKKILLEWNGIISIFFRGSSAITCYNYTQENT